jgi:tripartite-type tricarboxylate transporter receptor subunit TctC
MKFGKSMSGLVTAATTILTATPAYTQESFPNKPIRIIVGYAAGGGNDVIARVVAEKMSKGLGQPVLVENKPGAHSIIAAQYVAAAKSDGYTLFMGPNGPLTINPAIYSKLPYSPTRDFVPVALIGTYPLILVVSSSHSAKSVPELVKYAKDSPGKANYAASAATFQLASELFNHGLFTCLRCASAFQRWV